MPDISRVRLIALRGIYLFITTGLAAYLWPQILDPNVHWAIAEGQADCMLAAFSLLCLLGVFYPLRMLPVLLWETLWKTLWLLIVPLPQWLAGHLGADLQQPVFACSLVLLVYLAVPWPYVATRFFAARHAPA